MSTLINNKINEAILLALRELDYPGYSKVKNTLLGYNGVTRVFKVQELLDNPKVSVANKDCMKIVLYDIQNNK